MNEGVITIDLNNRTFKDSIILDIGSLKEKEVINLNFNIKSSLEKIKNSLKCGAIKNINKELCSIAPYIELNKNHNLFNEYYVCSTIYSKIVEGSNIIKEDKKELEKFLSLKEMYNYLKEFKISNDISYFEDIYEECLEDLEDITKECNIINILYEFKHDIKLDKNVSYIVYIIDKLEYSYLYNEEEKELLSELKGYIEKLKEEQLIAYNTNQNRDIAIRILIPYTCKEVLQDVEVERYIKILKESYENYKQFSEDFKSIYALYKLNTCEDYYEYNSVIITLPLRELIMLSNYARQYIIRKLFEKHKNYYTIQEVTEEIKEIMKTLNIKQNTNVIPL